MDVNGKTTNTQQSKNTKKYQTLCASEALFHDLDFRQLSLWDCYGQVATSPRKSMEHQKMDKHGASMVLILSHMKFLFCCVWSLIVVAFFDQWTTSKHHPTASWFLMCFLPKTKPTTAKLFFFHKALWNGKIGRPQMWLLKVSWKWSHFHNLSTQPLRRSFGRPRTVSSVIESW